MRLASPDMIPRIDAFAERELGHSVRELMGRSGKAVADAVRGLATPGATVLLLLGSGNNGGDGYAAASYLLGEYEVVAVDVFSAGQRTDAGRYYLEKYLSGGGRTVSTDEARRIIAALPAGSVIVDGVFGTGFRGEAPSALLPLITEANASRAHRVAIDLPFGVNAYDGSVGNVVLRADVTVALSYSKPGLHSYPAAEYAGRVIIDGLGLDPIAVERAFEFHYTLTDEAFAASALPNRPRNSNKGSFGKALLITGSDAYRGAAHLALQAALRGGAGLVSQVGTRELCAELRASYPEALYFEADPHSGEDASRILDAADRVGAVLLGSGCGTSEALAALAEGLISREGGPLVLDADAINSIAKYRIPEVLRRARRRIVLTPHPLEFSRISGIPVDKIQSERLRCAENFAREYGVILLLKGAATVITDGTDTFVNSTGGSALAKGGSGDVLAGLCAALLVCDTERLSRVALAAYLHGRAGDELSEEISDFAVTPSDLPVKIGKIIKGIIKGETK